jgi:hypothetical protein
LQNQEPKNGYGVIQAELYDHRAPEFKAPAGIPSFFGAFASDTGSTFGPGGNEMGVYLAADDKTVFTYKDVNLGRGPSEFLFRLASREDASVEVWADEAGEGGIFLGSLEHLNTGDQTTYKTFSAELAEISGTHDIYLKYSGSSRVNWFQFL